MKRFLVVFALLVGVAGCQRACPRAEKAPGVTDKEIYIGTSQPFSGPAAVWGNVAKGMKAWFEYINEKLGGVHGRKIILLAEDDGYIPRRTLANVQKLADKVLLFAGLLGTANLNTVKEFIAQKGVPVIMPLADVRIWVGWDKQKLRYFFVAYPDYKTEAEQLAKFAVERLGARKIAVFYQNDSYGKHGLEGVRAVTKPVAEVPHELTETDFSQHAQKIKESGADALIIYSNPRHTSILLKKLGELGFKPYILTSFTLGDKVMFKLAGEMWEGVYTGGGLIEPLDLSPNAQRIFKIITEKYPELARMPNIALYGVHIAMVVVEALRRAGPNPTREKVIKALETFRDFKTDIGYPITWTPDRRHGINGFELLQAKGGRYVRVLPVQYFDPLF